MSPDRTRAADRDRMVRLQIQARGISDRRVLQALRVTPRERFISSTQAAAAYNDSPLPIGDDQTISQPYIVALMTQLLDLSGTESVLEIGTGCGYQTAILAELAATVHTVEIVPALAARARDLLHSLGYGNIRFREGDGSAGWPEAAPFDRIMVTAAPRKFPDPLRDQLAMGGCVVVPVGTRRQQLLRVVRTPDGYREETHGAVRFVPMTGDASRGR
jgi:protein-L-isoaspartate(D-aspartate) O-methyltransferase